MKSSIQLNHRIKERTLEEIKLYYQPEVFIEYCKVCQYYDKIWTCPPYEADMGKVLEDYQNAYIIGSKLYINELGEDFRELLENKDLEYVSHQIYKAARNMIDVRLEAIENENKNISALLAGRCLVCNSCTREKQMPCLYPEKIHFSLESIGFDVASICQEILGDEIKWAKERLPEYFILVSAILSKDRLNIEDLYNKII